MTLDDIERYLQSLNSTLWGRSFDLSDAEGRRNAAKYLLATFDAIQSSVEVRDRHAVL